MPTKKKRVANKGGGGEPQKQGSKKATTADVVGETVAAETALSELLGTNTRLMRDKTATDADITDHMEKLNALVCRFGAALAPAAHSICDAIMPFVLARPPTLESAWRTAASASLLIPSAAPAMFTLVVDHLFGAAGVSAGRIPASASFTKDHGAAVVRDAMFRPSSTSASVVRQALRRIAVSALPLCLPEHRFKFASLLGELAAMIAWDAMVNSASTAEEITTATHLIADWLDLATVAVLQSRPAASGDLIEAVHAVAARAMSMWWCASSLAVIEAAQLALSACSSVLHPLAAPPLREVAESLTRSATSGNAASAMAPSPMFARSAVMPSGTAGGRTGVAPTLMMMATTSSSPSSADASSPLAQPKQSQQRQERHSPSVSHTAKRGPPQKQPSSASSGGGAGGGGSNSQSVPVRRSRSPSRTDAASATTAGGVAVPPNAAAAAAGAPMSAPSIMMASSSSYAPQQMRISQSPIPENQAAVIPSLLRPSSSLGGSVIAGGSAPSGVRSRSLSRHGDQGGFEAPDPPSYSRVSPAPQEQQQAPPPPPHQHHHHLTSSSPAVAATSRFPAVLSTATPVTAMPPSSQDFVVESVAVRDNNQQAPNSHKTNVGADDGDDDEDVGTIEI